MIVSLSEENFFKPVYQWHEDRGMIFGCDHGGRGKDISEFGDYFRTQRWNQGPDQISLTFRKILSKQKLLHLLHIFTKDPVYGSKDFTAAAGEHHSLM